MNFSLFKKYQNNKEDKEKKKFFNKLLESSSFYKLIIKIQDIYHKIFEKLFIKYDLKNELKQGKIFTILMAILIFLFLIILTIFFVVMLNSLLGINLIFNMLKYSLFIFKWGYTIIKNKGKVIEKYLENLFPNHKVKEIKFENLPSMEKNTIKAIEELLERIEKLDESFSNDKKEFIFEIQKVVGILKIQDNSLEKDIKSLEYKMNIIINKDQEKEKEEHEFNYLNVEYDSNDNIPEEMENNHRKYIKTL